MNFSFDSPALPNSNSYIQNLGAITNKSHVSNPMSEQESSTERTVSQLFSSSAATSDQPIHNRRSLNGGAKDFTSELAKLEQVLEKETTPRDLESNDLVDLLERRKQENFDVSSQIRQMRSDSVVSETASEIAADPLIQRERLKAAQGSNASGTQSPLSTRSTLYQESPIGTPAVSARSNGKMNEDVPHVHLRMSTMAKIKSKVKKLFNLSNITK